MKKPVSKFQVAIDSDFKKEIDESILDRRVKNFSLVYRDIVRLGYEQYIKKDKQNGKGKNVRSVASTA